MLIRFTKMQGAGNDFVMLNETQQRLNLTPGQYRFLAVRHFGVGAERILSVRRASRAKWGPLLRSGVRIYEYQPTMYHTKVMVVDDIWASVGSTNFDDRSFRLNDEANLNVLDAGFGQEQARQFSADQARSREVTLAAWERRPMTEKVQERFARLVKSQL